MINRTK